MTLTIPWLYVEVARALAVCVTAGAVIGAAGVLLRMVGERRGR